SGSRRHSTCCPPCRPTPPCPPPPPVSFTESPPPGADPAPLLGAPAASPRRLLRREPTMVAGLLCLVCILLTGLAAPYLGTVDPTSIRPITRLREPSAEFWFGTDQYGRDIYSRTLYGGRISPLVRATV